ncbi:MAG: hypothetical protein ACI8WB_003032 [Phenylobacterium sp.]|jgi:hypothetical protein
MSGWHYGLFGTDKQRWFVYGNVAVVFLSAIALIV